ncbi:MAG: ABC transporter permease [Malacoplasma sp.]|nr:ABC transporter permease [Malacoplasma sp.]MDE7075028.1 ABC transporter permease [Malacoplasma sp.]
MSSNNKNIKILNMPKLDFEVTEKDFERVDIYKLNRTDQVVGKPSKYLLDIIKRFAANRWALVFLIFFVLIILLAIFAPIISDSLGYTATGYIAGIKSNQWIKDLPPRLHGELPTVTKHLLSRGTVDEYANAGILKSSELDPLTGLWTATYSPYELEELKNVYPILGTDGSGVDIWNKLWTSVGMSLLLAFWVSILSVIIGVVYGSIAGAFAGKAPDTIMMRFVEIISGVPSIVWLLILGVVLKGGSDETTVTLDSVTVGLSLLFILWFSPAIATRTYIMKTKDVEYVQATRTLGGSQARVIFLHMIPVIAGRISVIFVNLIPTVIFYEATLSFLGLKPPSNIGLGVMLTNAQTISNIPEMVSPIFVFALFTISAQIIANALNDAIDPRVIGR